MAKYGVQFTNGASGLQPVDDLLITGFNILMTNWFVLFYSVYDQEVSFRHYGTPSLPGDEKQMTAIEKEKQLPFTMASLYSYTRTFINRKRFLKLVFYADLYSIIAGIVIWFIWDGCERNYIISEEGQASGLYTYGVYLTMSVVIGHHMQVVINTRNWGTFLTGWALFSISMLPFTLWLSQIVPKSNILKSTYRTILKMPMLWLAVLVTATIIVMPLYINKKWLQNVRYPQFYQV